MGRVVKNLAQDIRRKMVFDKFIKAVHGICDPGYFICDPVTTFQTGSDYF